MARGTPDDAVGAYSAAGVVTDLGDVIAFAQGISRIDNLGRPVLVDTFANGLLRWHLFQVSAAFPTAETLVTTNANNRVAAGFAGPVGCYLDSVGPGGLSQILSYWVVGDLSTAGLECAFKFPDDTIPSGTSRTVRLAYQTPGAVSAQQITVFITSPSAGIYRFSVLSLPFPSFFEDVPIVGAPWVQFKIVGDFSTGLYSRLIIGNKLVDISDRQITAYVGGPLDGELISEIIAAAGAQPYLGYVVLTRDEP